MMRKKLIIVVLLCLLSAQAVQAAPAFGFFGEVFSGIKSFFGFGDEDSKEAPPTIPPPDLGEVNPPLTPEELGPISVKDIPPPELLEESEEDVANKQKAVDQLGALTASVGQVLDLRHNPDIDLFDALFDIKKRLGDVKETFSCPEGYYMIIKGDDCPIVSEGQLKKAFDRMDEVVDSLGEDLSSPGVNDLLDGSDSYFRFAHDILLTVISGVLRFL